MAKISVGTSYTALPMTSGTIYNSGMCSVEISSDKSDGLVVRPEADYQFDDIQLYIRAGQDTSVVIVPFIRADYVSNAENITGGSSSGSSGSSSDSGNGIASEGDIDAIF